MIKLAGDVLPVTDADRLLVTLSLQPSRLAVDLVGCIEVYPAILTPRNKGMSEPGAFWTYLPFMPLKARNILLDCIFYDVMSLTPDEQFQLGMALGPKGSIVLVPPTDSGRQIHFYDSALPLMTEKGDQLRAVTVAGVGSSIFGTAALARNVADAINDDVAGIVSGYGLADYLEEAWGGWFFFGALDRIQRGAEDFLHNFVAGNCLPPERGFLNLPFSVFDPGVPGWGIPGDEDTATLGDILMARPQNLDLLVGHSKGSLVIDCALEQFVYDLGGRPNNLLDQLQIVTLGAVADLPHRFPKVTQIIGGTDWFGGMNSRLNVQCHPWELSFHHLNQLLPRHLNAVEAIKRFRAGTLPPLRESVITAFAEAAKTRASELMSL